MKLIKEIFKKKLLTASFFLKSSLLSTSVSGILLESSERGIEIYSTDLTSFYHSYIPTKADKEFSLIVEPKKIIEVLNTLSSEDLTLEVEEKRLILKSGRTKATFAITLSKDYPKPGFKKTRKSRFSKKVLEKLPLVLFSAAGDDSRPVLTGVNFEKRDDSLFLVATDGFRLSLIKTKEDVGVQEGSYIIPADFLKIILKEAKEEELEFYYNEDEKMVLFSFGDDEFFSRTIDGEFPPYNKVIPESFNSEILLNRDEFLRNIKFASIFAKDYSNVVIFDIKKDGLYIYPKTEAEVDGSQAFQEVLSVKGEEVKVAFNFKFVLEFLNHASGDEIRVKIVGPEAPVVFEMEGEDDFLHIIMPVRISE